METDRGNTRKREEGGEGRERWRREGRGEKDGEGREEGEGNTNCEHVLTSRGRDGGYVRRGG